MFQPYLVWYRYQVFLNEVLTILLLKRCCSTKKHKKTLCIVPNVIKPFLNIQGSVGTVAHQMHRQ